MSNLKEYAHQHEVFIDGKKYVNEKNLLDFLNKRFCDERKDCKNDDERNGIDICRNVLANWN